MNKKIFGIKLGTFITALVCLIVAFVIWIYVEYDRALDAGAISDSSDVQSDC